LQTKNIYRNYLIFKQIAISLNCLCTHIVYGLPITVDSLDKLKDIKDKNLHMYLFAGIYEMKEGRRICSVFELVLNEILNREEYWLILIRCLYWVDAINLVLNENEVKQTCINLLNSAIERARNAAQREAILELKASYLKGNE